MALDRTDFLISAQIDEKTIGMARVVQDGLQALVMDVIVLPEYVVEFSEGFIEPDWCTHGHSGIVLDGSFAIDYNGNIERYSKDDVIFIPNGEDDRHKAIIDTGEKVTLLLFELLEG